jgi:hypothetical protein
VLNGLPKGMRMRVRMAGVLLCLSLGLGGCNRSTFETPQMQGPAAMVESGGKPSLWLLSKQEEKRQVGVFGGSRRNTATWRTDTFFHFSVEAIDPLTTKTLWKQRLVTFGDPDAKGPSPSRIIGSAESARMLGQDGDIVWLLIGDAPYGVSAADGHILADAAGIEAANPALKGLLPSEARHYNFDRGLVFMSADARQFVVRGAKHLASEYVPTPREQSVPVRLKPNGMPVIVPMRPPMGEVPARQAQLGGQWLGLYSQKEAEDLLDDDTGQGLQYPYSIVDEGSLARRSFLRAKIVEGKRFDETFQHVAELTPVPDAPVFLKGRFFRRPGTDDAVVLDNPVGLLVWHSTRMDDAGRLALARVDESLHTVWKSELPLSETDAVRSISSWHLPGHVVVVGELRSVDDGGVHHRDPYLVSVDLKTGEVHSRNLDAKE